MIFLVARTLLVWLCVLWPGGVCDERCCGAGGQSAALLLLSRILSSLLLMSYAVELCMRKTMSAVYRRKIHFVLNYSHTTQVQIV